MDNNREPFENNQQPQEGNIEQPQYNAPQPPYNPLPNYGMPSQQPTVVPGKGLGIAGMVLGIVGLVFFCIPYIGFPCSVIGLVLSGVSSSKAKKSGMKNGMATAGIVLSVIALAIDVLGVTALAGLASSILDYA